MVRRLVPLALVVTTTAALASFATAGASNPPIDTTQPPTTVDQGPPTTAAPPVTDPPATDPPATDPPATDAPDTLPLPETSAAPGSEPSPGTVSPPAPNPVPAATTTTQVVPPAGPVLKILLTNDDGWDAEGITAVRAALIAAGHDVVIVAPATNQSGVGGRVTLVGELTLTQHADGVFSVDGSPADATEIGLDIAFGGERPDLVISGTNAGQNIGATAVHSGTLGAAVTALNDGVPAIAVSTETDLTTGEGDITGTASFVVTAVQQLVDRADGGPLLPEGIGLSINFPFVESGGPAGVAITTTDSSFLELDYSAVSIPEVGSETVIGPVLTIVDPIDPDGDAARLAADFVTITFITGDYDVVAPGQVAALDELGPLLVDLGL